MFIGPAVAGHRVFVGSCSGRVVALDAASGELVWSHDTAAEGARAQFHGEAAIAGELLLIGADGRPAAHLYAFDRQSGAKRWSMAFAGGVPTDLRLAGDAVLGVTMAGRAFALATAGGVPEWIGDEPPAEERGGRPLDAVVVEDRLIVPSRSGIVVAYAVADGERLWRSRLPGAPTTSPVAAAGAVWVGTAEGRLLSLSAADGSLGRTLSATGFFYGDLVTAGDCVLALRAEGPPDGDGGFGGPHVLACFAVGSGEERWRYESASEWGSFRPLVVGEAVVVGREGEVLALSARDGSPLWRLPVDGLARGLGHAAGTLYVGTMQGAVTAHAWPER